MPMFDTAKMMKKLEELNEKYGDQAQEYVGKKYGPQAQSWFGKAQDMLGGEEPGASQGQSGYSGSNSQSSYPGANTQSQSGYPGANPYSQPSNPSSTSSGTSSYTPTPGNPYANIASSTTGGGPQTQSYSGYSSSAPEPQAEDPGAAEPSSTSPPSSYNPAPDNPYAKIASSTTGGEPQTQSYSGYSSSAPEPQAEDPGAAEPSSTLPPLNDLDAWFDYYDRDGSGQLEKEEVVNALIATCTSAGHDVDSESMREDFDSAWPEFDKNGSGSIDRTEFMAPGGLGESMQAMMMLFD